MPALPLHEAGRYVAAAYIVFFGLILVYVAVMAARLARIQRDLGELVALVQRQRERPGEAGVHVGAGAADVAQAPPEAVGAPRR